MLKVVILPDVCRPHPAVWRVVHGIGLIYLLVLVFVLFLSVSQARQALKVSMLSHAQISSKSKFFLIVLVESRQSEGMSH